MSKILHELIHSLSTSEKVYFTRSANTHGAAEEKNYMKIYHAYEASSSYDRNSLQEKFQGSTLGKYMSSEINYLKDKILISLFNHNMNSSKRNQIQKGILIIEALTSKGFMKEALKKLKPIKRLAIDQEEFTWILWIIELEEIILFKEGSIGYRATLEKLHQERKNVTATIQNLNSYHVIRQEVRELQFSELLLLEDLPALKEMTTNPLVSQPDQCMSIKSKKHWYYIQVLLSYLKRDFQSGLTISADYISFMNANKHLFDTKEFLPTLSNYIYHAALCRNRNHFLKGLEFLTSISIRKEISQTYYLYILYTRHLEFHFYTDNLSQSEKFLNLSIILLEQNEEQFEESQAQYLYMLIVRAAILNRTLNLAMKYCNLWHRRGVLKYRKVQARLFSIMINFELNNFELIKSEIVLLKKEEKTNQRDRQLIKIFYSFFKSIVKNPKNRQTKIVVFQNQLAQIATHNKGYFDFISFDYSAWANRLTESED